MPVNDETIRHLTERITAEFQKFALGNEGFVRVGRFAVHYPEVDLEITVRAKETERDPIFQRRHTIFNITAEVQGTINVTKIKEAAEKLTLTLHTPFGNPSISIENAIELATLIATVLA
jgi:hypothetical protein